MLINLAAFVVIIAGVISAKSLIIPFLLAAFLAIIWAPTLFWMKKRGIPSIFAILLLVLVLVGVEMFLTGIIGSSLSDFSRNLPTYQHRFAELSHGLIDSLAKYGVTVQREVFEDYLNPGKLMPVFANMLGSLTGLLKNTFMITLTLVFILLEASGFPDKLRAMLGSRSASLNEYSQIMRGVNKYLALKSLTSLATGILATILLKNIGVDFAMMWGLVAFMLNFVPTIGSIIAAVPPTLVALVQFGYGPAAGVIIGYLVINTLIGNIIEPKIMGSGVGLSPLVILISMTFWGWVLGPVGMLLSVPLTMTFKIALYGNENTRWLAILLGSNREATQLLDKPALEEKEK